jgi:pilus assembly protein Flp/PilA
MRRHIDAGRLHLESMRRLAADGSGATAVEYGLIAALIALAVFAGISTVGSGIKNTLYGQIVTALQNMGN